MPRLWREFDHDLAYVAAEKCFRDKWQRGDVRTFIEEWTGHSRKELTANEYINGKLRFGLKYEILQEIALVVEDMVADIVSGRDPELDPVTVKARKDAGTGKVRNIATLCYRHQLLGHTVKAGIDRLLAARILPTQHASIPGKGQTGLARQVKRMLNRKLGIKCFQKMDGVQAYASIQYSKVGELMRDEIPRARWIHACMKKLGEAAPGGYLIIGGYLDAWLFNYVMSYGLRYVLSLKKSRRGNDYPLVIRAVTFMDDVVLMARSESGLKQAVRKLSEWLADQYGMKSRTTTSILRIGSVLEERTRKDLPGARRGVVAIDAGGFRISRTHITMRKRNAPRVMRSFRRAWEEYQRTGTIKRQRAGQLICRNGMIQNANSRKFIEKYHVTELMRVARRVQAYWGRVETRKRKERIRNAYQRHEKQRAALCDADG